MPESDRGRIAGVSVRTRILTAQHAATRDGYPPPTRVFLTWAEETALEIELSVASYALAHEIRRHGLRKALHHIHGLEIVWNSGHFAVE